MTRRELIKRLTEAGEPVYGRQEAAAIARLIAEKRYRFTRADLALEPQAEVNMGGFDGLPDEESAEYAFERLLSDIAAARPVQYILGSADFDDMELIVEEGVLIPRPETEELVRWIIANYESGTWSEPRKNETTNILDIGTGSGAIAIALAKRLPQAHITAIDISPEALKCARQNSESKKTGIRLLRADILDSELELGKFDAIVSNPPYIPASERSQMADNVVRYEPATALFVPDDDPLLFYRAIAGFARRSLVPGGALYFEIHENAAENVAGLLACEGFTEVKVREDINSKPRMVRCRL